MRSRQIIARRRGIIVLVLFLCIVAAALGLWQASARRHGIATPIEHLLTEVLAPSARATAKVRDLLVRDPTTTITTTIGVDAYTQLQEENQQLRAALQLRDNLPQLAIAADVIGRVLPPNPWQGAVLLGKGSADGLAARMLVITPNGVLGQVQTVTGHTANVLPLTAADHTERGGGIGARTRRTHATGMLKGAGNGLCVLEYLKGDQDVQPGDLVETSGFSFFFPAGYTLGTVQKVIADPAVSSRRALVVPAVDIDRVQVVLVIGMGH